jgi:hypothetical protein
MELDQCRRRDVSIAPSSTSEKSSNEYHVRTVREMLNQVTFSPLPASDKWDEGARAQMRKFQESEGIARLTKRIECSEASNAYYASRGGDVLPDVRSDRSNPLHNETVNHVAHIGHEAMEAAEKLAHMFAPDAALREGYMKEVRAGVDAILAQMRSGKLTPGQAAFEASKLRNALLDATRKDLSPAAAALSRFMKEEGVKFPALLQKYSQKLFAKTPKELTPAEGEKVLLAIAERAGVTNAWVNRLGTAAAKAGPYLKALGMAMAIVQVATAEDPKREAVKAVAAWAGFEAGAWAGAAAAPACGPAAPACLVVFPLVFGLVGSILADKAAGAGYDHVVKG